MTTLDLTIESVGARGDGRATWNGGGVHVPLTAPGDRVRVRLLPGGRRGEAARAEMIELLEAGPDRVDPVCPRFGTCGGCALQHRTAAANAAWKTDLVARELARVGLADAPIEAIVSAPPGTRRRARFAAIRRGRSTRLGFNERAGKRIIDPEPCPVCAPALLRPLPALRELLGAIVEDGRDVDAAVTLVDGGALDICLIGPVRTDLDARERMAAFADANDIARLSLRSADDASPEPVAHRRPVTVSLAGVPVTPPPGGFLQAAPEGERALLDVVGDATRAARRVIDLFSGIGTFAVPTAVAGATVTAIEGDREAVQALTAARVPRLTAIRRDLFRDPLEGRELEGIDALVFDPPRAGAAAQARALAESGVPVIVAVSCRPAAFARDARILVDGGYVATRVRPVDQFLWSPHVELAAVFERRG